MIVLQISDCHLVAAGDTLLGIDTQATLEAVLEHAVAAHQPDAIIASGDLAHAPLAEVYERFGATVRRYTNAPLLCLPGNHDVLAPMVEAGLPMEALQIGNWNIVPLDSHQDDAPAALVEQADRDVAGRALAAASGDHCLVATHHPLVEVNSPWLDKDRIQNPAELVEWLSECSAVSGISRLRGVVFGHAHQAVEEVCGGVPVLGVPSTCFQFLPQSERFSLDDQAPGYRWLFLDDKEGGSGGGFTSRVERLNS